MTRRRFTNLLRYLLAGLLMFSVVQVHDYLERPDSPQVAGEVTAQYRDTLAALEQLAVKGRAPKTGYERAQFGSGWQGPAACDTRDRILKRDLSEAVFGEEGCEITQGLLHDPYGGKDISFVRGAQTSDDVQIDHVVALSDAWQKGAQQLSYETRVEFANDPLELLAVSGELNQEKGDGDAATWLPPNKAFRCNYVERQIEVKHKYGLWITAAEKEAMLRVLQSC